MQNTVPPGVRGSLNLDHNAVVQLWLLTLGTNNFVPMGPILTILVPMESPLKQLSLVPKLLKLDHSEQNYGYPKLTIKNEPQRCGLNSDYPVVRAVH